ncbi:MAG: suppressor of fused domain protein, partial [Myxococcales bacterium]|nr:suppressor of fused domain protein [Myxococcales bacterium]
YADAVAQDVGGARRLQPLSRYPGAPQVAAFRSRRRTFGVLYVTLGVGAQPREAPGVPEEERRVELLARAEEAGVGVAEVLQALAKALAAADAAGEPWKGYEPVALEAPARGLAYFDLIPAGTARAEDGDVTLLRVVPLTAEEYEAAKAARGSQWSGSGGDPEAGDDSRARWAPALRPDVPADPS